MANQIQFISTNTGAVTNGLRTLFKIPSGYGGITVIKCNYTNPGVGTSWVKLVDLGTTGTAVSKVVADAGTVVSVAGVPQAIAVTAANSFIDEGHWVGFQEANIGATNAVSMVDVAFVAGK